MPARHEQFDIPILATLLLLAAATGARADDFANCMQGMDRYNANVAELQNAREQCMARSDQIRADSTLSDDEKEMQLQTKCPIKQAVCVKIRPEQGYAACEAFLQSGAGNDSTYAPAQQANDTLKSLYDECTAQ